MPRILLMSAARHRSDDVGSGGTAEVIVDRQQKTINPDQRAPHVSMWNPTVSGPFLWLVGPGCQWLDSARLGSKLMWVDAKKKKADVGRECGPDQLAWFGLPCVSVRCSPTRCSLKCLYGTAGARRAAVACVQQPWRARVVQVRPCFARACVGAQARRGAGRRAVGLRQHVPAVVHGCTVGAPWSMLWPRHGL